MSNYFPPIPVNMRRKKGSVTLENHSHSAGAVYLATTPDSRFGMCNREADKSIEGNHQTGKANEHGNSAKEHADVPAHIVDQSMGMTGFRLCIALLHVAQSVVWENSILASSL